MSHPDDPVLTAEEIARANALVAATADILSGNNGFPFASPKELREHVSVSLRRHGVTGYRLFGRARGVQIVVPWADLDIEVSLLGQLSRRKH